MRRLLQGIACCLWRKDEKIQEFAAKHPTWFADLEALVVKYNDPRIHALFAEMKMLFA